jgi:guanosine-3',5'-bis(diphosphate) 3'-pyrophosphohydrolase
MEPTGTLLRALEFAAARHRDQRRKDALASPYINHPIAVAAALWHEGEVRDPVALTAAILHDTIEDTATTAAELAARFGAEVGHSHAGSRSRYERSSPRHSVARWWWRGSSVANQ